ncbi:unnamed protein product [Somion occarium]|uniref:DUF6535 domain-containing protein n=1 Tax=Somion occarium TaxID=3059160 RepID=A0ABP1DXX0_9APHY
MRADQAERVDASHPESAWKTMDKHVRTLDEEKVEDFKEDIDTLLVFAGLFSAVTTTLLIESYKLLQPDQTSVNNILLSHIYLRLLDPSSTALPTMDIACIAASTCPFQPSLAARRVNIFWFASLILSLVTASFGMLVKQWLREFLSGGFALPQTRLRIRYFRYLGIIKWRVFEIAALLPLLLQLALALFFAGLCIFASDIHSSIGSTSIMLVSIWAILFETMRQIRALLYEHVSQIRPLYDTGSDYSVAGDIMGRQTESYSLFEEESFATNAPWHEDLDILLAIDAALLDDQLLAQGFSGLLSQSSLELKTPQMQILDYHEAYIMPFILKVIDNRIQNELGLSLRWRMTLHGQLDIKAWTAIVDIVADLLLRKLSEYSLKMLPDNNWVADAVTILLSISEHPLPLAGRTALSHCLQIDPRTFSDVICTRTPIPTWASHSEAYSLQHSGDTDVLTALLESELQGVLPMLHGEALLSAIYHLLRSRFCTGHNCKHRSLSDFLVEHPLNNVRPVIQSSAKSWLLLSPAGGFRMIADLLVNELDEVFNCEPNGLQPVWIYEAILVVFGHRSYWSKDHQRKISRWLCQHPPLAWYIRLATPNNQDHPDLFTLLVEAAKDLCRWMSISDRQAMLLHISEILRLDYVTDSLANQSMVQINNLGLCFFVLELLQLQSVSASGRAQLEQYSLKRAWKTICSSLAASMAAGTATGDVEVQRTTVQRCLSLIGYIREFGVHSEVDESLNQLVSALRVKLLGPQVAGGVSKLLTKAAGQRDARANNTGA